MTQNVSFEHIWDYFGNILSSSCVFFYFMKNLKNVYHINETQEYFSYRSNFGCYITQHFDCISWKYEFLLKFSICCKKLHYFVVLWASFGFLCVSFGFLCVSFGFLWVNRRTRDYHNQTSNVFSLFGWINRDLTQIMDRQVGEEGIPIFLG